MDMNGKGAHAAQADGIVRGWRWRRRDGLALLEAAVGPYAFAFTSRAGGVSAAPFDSLNMGRSTGDRSDDVTENRRRLFDALGIDPGRVSMAHQVHGADLARVDTPTGGLVASDPPRVDALLTTRDDIALMLQYADCVPVFLAHPGGRGVALAHAGWRGLAAGVVGVAVGALAATAGDAPGAIWAAVAPCIGPSYQVDEAVMVPMRARFAWADAYRGPDGVLDMAGAVHAALVEAGVRPQQILTTGERTESPAFFSHRVSGGRTGRMAGVAWRPTQIG